MSLLNKLDKRTYGPSYRDHVLEQYKIIVRSAEKISDRRNIANNFYLGLNTALIALIGVSTKVEELFWVKPIVYLVGISLAIVFWYLINSYKQLNNGKFKVIHEIEEFLPLNVFKHEWKILGEGKDKNLYYPFSHVERYIPLLLGATYFILLLPYIIQIVNSFCEL